MNDPSGTVIILNTTFQNLKKISKIFKKIPFFPRKLFIHSESLYYCKVVAQDSVKVAQIVKECMENAMPDLSVPFPVKVKIGPSWGQLVEMRNYE